jgi:hypothetical protein
LSIFSIRRENAMSKAALTLEEQFRLDEMIDASVIARYDGDLQRLGPDQDGGSNYVPLDVEGVSDLLTCIVGRASQSRDDHRSFNPPHPRRRRTLAARLVRR